MPKNYYVILGVSPNAEQDEIKVAFRDHAKSLHPDVSGSNPLPFQELVEAYGVLSDPERRREYDSVLGMYRYHNFGDDGWGPTGSTFAKFKAKAESNPWINSVITKVEDWVTFILPWRTDTDDYRNKKFNIDVKLSPRQAAKGGKLNLKIYATMRCPSCKSNRRVFKELKKCEICNNEGHFFDVIKLAIPFPGNIIKRYSTLHSLDDFGLNGSTLKINFNINYFRNTPSKNDTVYAYHYDIT